MHPAGELSPRGMLRHPRPGICVRRQNLREATARLRDFDPSGGTGHPIKVLGGAGLWRVYCQNVQGVLLMPVLPMIDLLILMGWTCLAVGAIMKAIAITTNYQPYIFTFGPYEFYEIAVLLLLFAVALAARTWVKAHEPEILAKQRRVSTLHAVTRAKEKEESDRASGAHLAQPQSAPEVSRRRIDWSLARTFMSPDLHQPGPS